MKQVIKFAVLVKTFIGVVTLLLLQTLVFAQGDKGADIDINVKKEGGDWYTQPWVWIVGGAVFLLLLIALLRGGGNRNRD
jgi:hypothetical protein